MHRVHRAHRLAGALLACAVAACAEHRPPEGSGVEDEEPGTIALGLAGVPVGTYPNYEERLMLLGLAALLARARGRRRRSAASPARAGDEP